MLIVLLVVGLCCGGWYLAWRRVGARMLLSPEYQVGIDQIEITPPPVWIRHDIRRDVLLDPVLEGQLSIMDDDLTRRIHKAFSDHPWVARVGEVSKHFPALVKVPLEYRRPVCMVEVPGGVLPVDAEGVLLPSEDFSPVEASRYPRLSGVDQKPSGPAGRRWGDAKVVGGAEIAAALKQDWEAMKLDRIVPLAADPSQATGVTPGRPSREPFFILLTRAGTKILWGYAPGANMLGELPAAEKVARLKQYLDKHDSLDAPQNQRQELDVRQLGNPTPAR